MNDKMMDYLADTINEMQDCELELRALVLALPNASKELIRATYTLTHLIFKIKHGLFESADCPHCRKDGLV